MYRATTPIHTFIFEVDPDAMFKSILITYAQGNEIVLEKNKNAMTFRQSTDCHGNVVYEGSLKLTQEESNLFSTKSSVTVQIRALTYEDDAVASDKMNIAIRAVLNDEVLV